MTSIIVVVKDGTNMDEVIKLKRINNKLHLALNCAIELIENYLYHDNIKYTDTCKRMKRLIKEINMLEEK